ncbi:MAG: HesB/IscA family protein [Thermoguttaceae bacterium]
MTVTMTSRAIDEVRKIKAAKNLGDETFLRIGIVGGGCSGMLYSLNFDTVFDDVFDTNYKFDEIMLGTNKKFDPHFDGTEIDFQESQFGAGFAIENPNFPKRAGCPGCGH